MSAVPGDRALRSAVFRHVRGSADVYLVAPAYRDEVLALVRSLGLPRVVHNSMFDDLTETWPLLTGVVTRLDAVGIFGPRSGVRVYGQQPVRLLCHLLDLRGRSRSLDQRRSDAALVRALDVQRRLPPAAAINLTQQAMRRGADTTDDHQQGCAGLPGVHLTVVSMVVASGPPVYYVWCENCRRQLPGETRHKGTAQQWANEHASSRELRDAARLLDEDTQAAVPVPPEPPARRVGPSRYYVTPRLTVDRDQGPDIPSSDAAALIEAGVHVTVRSEQTAREVLTTFDMTSAEIDSAIRFGQTGQV